MTSRTPSGRFSATPSAVPIHRPLDELQRTGVDEVAQDLGDEERVALGLAVDRVGEELGRFLAADRLDEVLDARRASDRAARSVRRAARVATRRSCRRAGAAVEIDVSIGADDRDPLVAEVAREVLEHEQRRLVGPVQVVEHDHDRVLARGVAEEGRRPPRTAAAARRHRRGRWAPGCRGSAGAAPTRASRSREPRCRAPHAARRRRARARR